MKNRRLSKIYCAIALVLALTLPLDGCGAQKKDTAPIRVAISDDVTSLDVAGTKDVLSETVGRCVFSTLYTFDENLKLIPCLVETAEQTSELKWTFTIREDAKFHDGSTITASDAVFSLIRAQTVKQADQSLLIMEKIEAVDNTTLRITTKEPMANLPSLLVRTSTSVMSEKAMSDPNYNLEKPVGSGAFRVLEWEKGKEIRLERFDEYFGGAAQTELLSFVVESSEPNSTAALLNGTVDLLFRVAASEGDYLRLDDDVDLYQVDSTKTELLILNPRVEPMGDIRVRQAIACAIDKQNIVDNVLSGYGRVQSSMIPAPLMGFAGFGDYSYDQERAKELLTEAGYPNGFAFTVLTSDSQRKKLMEYIKLDLARVNIDLKYEFLELPDYLKLVEEAGRMGSIMSWTSNADPDSALTQLYSKAGHPTVNQSGFTDPRVEELLQQGRIATDSKKRDEIYKEANTIIAESYLSIPLYQPNLLIAARKEIGGVLINPQGLFGYENLYRTAEK